MIDDQDFQTLSETCAEILLGINHQRKSSLYWRLGRSIADFEDRHSEALEKGKARFLQVLASRMSVVLAKKRNGDGTVPSLRFFRAVENFGRLRLSNQIDDSVPWSIHFELLALGSDNQAWDEFIELYKSGRVRSKDVMRRMVASRKGRGTSTLPKRQEDKKTEEKHEEKDLGPLSHRFD
jgi:hypothetical protein